jgi:hypothetical protein
MTEVVIETSEKAFEKVLVLFSEGLVFGRFFGFDSE